MFLTTKALVLREVPYRDADRILTVLTDQAGRMTVRARGALRRGSQMAGSTQALCWSEMTLFGNRGRWTVNEASLLEPFAGLREDISRLALASYFAEVLESVCLEDEADPGALQLGLNALYALSRGLYSQKQIRAVFELRLLSLEGFQPRTGACPLCGNPRPAQPVFSPDLGMVHCAACRPDSSLPAVPLDRQSLAAMRYITTAAARKEFSFSIPDHSLDLLARAAEQFVVCQLDRRFSTLDYWKKVR